MTESTQKVITLDLIYGKITITIDKEIIDAAKSKSLYDFWLDIKGKVIAMIISKAFGGKQ
jgi:hypothetical protein